MFIAHTPPYIVLRHDTTTTYSATCNQGYTSARVSYSIFDNMLSTLTTRRKPPNNRYRVGFAVCVVTAYPSRRRCHHQWGCCCACRGGICAASHQDNTRHNDSTW